MLLKFKRSPLSEMKDNVARRRSFSGLVNGSTVLRRVLIYIMIVYVWKL